MIVETLKKELRALTESTILKLWSKDGALINGLKVNDDCIILQTSDCSSQTAIELLEDLELIPDDYPIMLTNGSPLMFLLSFMPELNIAIFEDEYTPELNGYI